MILHALARGSGCCARCDEYDEYEGQERVYTDLQLQCLQHISEVCSQSEHMVTLRPCGITQRLPEPAQGSCCLKGVWEHQIPLGLPTHLGLSLSPWKRRSGTYTRQCSPISCMTLSCEVAAH